jgi:hypothetical protein
MNTRQRIYTLLAKTPKQKFKADNAKASRKMAFALADDLVEAERILADSADRAEGYIALLQNAVTVVEELQRELETALGNYQLEEQYDEAERLLQEFNDNAFELGINPEQSAAYMNLKQTLSRAGQTTLDFLDWTRQAARYLNI